MEILLVVLAVIALSCWGISKLLTTSQEVSAEPFDKTSAPAPAQPRGSIWLSATDADELMGHLNRGDQLPIKLKRGPGGLLPTSPDGKHMAPGNRHLARLGVYWLVPRGRRFYEDERAQVVIRPKDTVTLKREPDNEHDANAIAVQVDGLTLGYVNKGRAKYLAKRIDAGAEYRAVALRVEPLSIMIGTPNDLAQLGL